MPNSEISGTSKPEGQPRLPRTPPGPCKMRVKPGWKSPILGVALDMVGGFAPTFSNLFLTGKGPVATFGRPGPDHKKDPEDLWPQLLASRLSQAGLKSWGAAAPQTPGLILRAPAPRPPGWEVAAHPKPPICGWRGGGGRWGGSPNRAVPPKMNQTRT
jgi:hypothetical protein